MQSGVFDVEGESYILEPCPSDEASHNSGNQSDIKPHFIYKHSSSFKKDADESHCEVKGMLSMLYCLQIAIHSLTLTYVP